MDLSVHNVNVHRMVARLYQKTLLMVVECPASWWLKQNPHEIVVHLEAK